VTKAAAPLVRAVDDAVDPKLFRAVFKGVRAVGRNASYWKTFWFPLAEEPTNVVERLALALLPNVPDSQRIAGIEWWLGRMRTTDVPLDFHHDRDLALFEQTGALAHPAWSSVYYLNAVRGGSLFVTDQALVRRGEELVLSPASPGAFATTRPAPNRFVLFPGRFLHGVLDANDAVPHGRLPRAPDTLRWSIVLNWWTHRPLAVKRWSEARAYRVLALPKRR
jgi:hypothetical protein